MNRENSPKNTKKSTEWIKIIGAREHNLKNVDLEIPKNKLTVITGPSGSGKSSLALDVLYTEGKRRYMESLSSYARQFLGIAKKPDFDRIEGLCPAIAIEQKTVGHNPRSTVGTITEIYDYLRVLYARIGKPHCPDCGLIIQQQSPENIASLILTQFKENMITIAAPIVNQKKGEFKQQLLQLYQNGFYRFIIDGTSYRFTSEDEIKSLKLAKTYKHSIDLLIDKLEITNDERSRVQEAIEKSFQLAEGLCKIMVGTDEHLYSSHRMCLHCSTAFPELEPRFFSFNSPIGACKECNGLGVIHIWPWKEGDKENWKSNYPDFFGSHAQEKTCRSCFGKRLHKHALAVTIQNKHIVDVCDFSIKEALAFFKELSLPETDQAIAENLIKEITSRFQFLYDVGLSYLTLNRSARTLSGGEGQRIRLATQIGSALSGVLYILDEPSIGLHQRDNDRLIQTLKTLRDQGNTVVVVEHDTDTMLEADYIVDMGPAAGTLGGHVTAVGNPKQLAENTASLTGAYLAGRRGIAIPKKRRTLKHFLTLSHAQKNNLKNLEVKVPLEVLCCISGVSGSGKSTLVLDEIVPAVQQAFAGFARKARTINDTDELKGLEHVDSLVVIDQSPIGRTPRSNPATYLGIFDEIRKLFTRLPESQARGYKPGRFSFNVAEGRCFECRGDGTITVSMQFLADVVMTCKICKGKRYNIETLTIRYRDKNIAEVLDMTALEAVEFFAAHKNIAKRLQLLCDVGLDYVKLGQSSITLSGGEAQRIKLVDELAKRGNKTLYILDEPTTGLHNSDIEKLLLVLNRLIDKGNSMIVIEHNIDVLKTADYIIDMGPEGGDAGGQVVAQGTPEQVAKNTQSHTGKYLKRMLASK
ncbi:MAG: excinuclease ABC subunit UvrA [Candidatus Babeliales bacterium]